MTTTTDLAERVWATAQRVGECLIFGGAPGLNGYGRLSIRGRSHYAHRVAFELANGPIPDGLTIDHLCRVRMCVNPDHLEVVTRSENSRREAAYHRAPECPSGHAFDAANTGIRPTGKRYCRACARERMRRRYSRKEIAA